MLGRVIRWRPLREHGADEHVMQAEYHRIADHRHEYAVKGDIGAGEFGSSDRLEVFLQRRTQLGDLHIVGTLGGLACCARFNELTHLLEMRAAFRIAENVTDMIAGQLQHRLQGGSRHTRAAPRTGLRIAARLHLLQRCTHRRARCGEALTKLALGREKRPGFQTALARFLDQCLGDLIGHTPCFHHFFRLGSGHVSHSGWAPPSRLCGRAACPNWYFGITKHNSCQTKIPFYADAACQRDDPRQAGPESRFQNARNNRMTNPLAGMYAALLTGLKKKKKFDPGRQKAIDAYVLEQGLDGLYVGGSSGESGLLGVDELLAQQAVVAEDAQGSAATLIAHVGVPNLRDSIRLAQNAQKLGYHGLSALPPHSYPFSDREIFAYYEALSAATDLPLIVYEVPVRTGRPFSLDLLGRILALPGVGGIKFTSMDLFKFATLRRRFPEKTFFFGFDEVYLSGAVMGAHGGIGTTYNLLGRLYAALNEAVKKGSLERAQELQTVSQRFVETLMETGVLPGMKAALRQRGVDCGPTRLPLAPLVDDCEARMSAILADPEIAAWVG